MTYTCQMLKDKRAVVTGAGQGLGEAIAERLIHEGCRVLIADVREPQIFEAAARLKKRLGGDVIGIPCDVTVESQVEALVERADKQWNGLDIFVANAGILVSDALTDFDVAKWRKVIDVNLVGQMLCMKHALRAMERQKSGSYIQINSKSGKKGSFKNSAYAASKFGAIGLVQSAALEMADKGVRINAVCPGNLLDSPLWVNSLFQQYAKNQGIPEAEVRQKYVNQVPMKRGCRYEDVGNVVVFLASDLSSYMTGQAINVTGGQEMR
ncbi:MAG: sorbitol-6-phosphate dehydrogenase [Verrucomicrobia bacterium]|nr:sorbitol-6-phosphate dehydrogenase [Verrucomicrobiota bacterium]MBU4291739.1 sorbitol-6-phosphate dehydrogenase [Verrucomicrobiota bacterium]MBU4429045.1 sorbitol-6-phosphate dehydrogenase [Verrucomicrobiota bacterium]MCG2679329.1 sorbitol-6-phosphate dehydrogenase [Kiritimatiellia bacterium]